MQALKRPVRDLWVLQATPETSATPTQDALPPADANVWRLREHKMAAQVMMGSLARPAVTGHTTPPLSDSDSCLLWIQRQTRWPRTAAVGPVLECQVPQDGKLPGAPYRKHEIILTSFLSTMYDVVFLMTRLFEFYLKWLVSKVPEMHFFPRLPLPPHLPPSVWPARWLLASGGCLPPPLEGVRGCARRAL